MYNNVGILTTRGTGTSGHVQNNKFNLRGRPPPRDDGRGAARAPERGPNPEILEHNRKREVEVKLVELADSLEEQGCAVVLVWGGLQGGDGGPRWRRAQCGRRWARSPTELPPNPLQTLQVQP